MNKTDSASDTSIFPQKTITFLKRFILNAALFAACFVVCFYFASDLYHILKQPFNDVMHSYDALMPQGSIMPYVKTATQEGMIVVQSPQGVFMIFAKIALFSAAVIVLPLLFAQFHHCKRHCYGVKAKWNGLVVLYLTALTLFLIGLSLAYFLLVPLGIQAFASMLPAEVILKRSWQVLFTASVLDQEMTLLLGMGLLFQFPYLLWIQRADETVR